MTITNQLINGLRRIAATNVELPLVPLNNNKQPLGDGWQHRPFSATQLIEAIENGGVTVPIKGKSKKIQLQGFGLLTGRPITVNDEIYYIMAVDQDGPSVIEKIKELSSGEGLPKTVAFTSGRPGRCQYLFLVPETFKDAIRTKKIKAGTSGEDGKAELLELRWHNLQSVLPPSVHPMTGQYHWVEGCAIDQGSMAIAPDWILELMLIDESEQQHELPLREVATTAHYSDVAPKQSQLPRHPDQIVVPVPLSVPLLDCCRKSVREWVATGVPEGSGRNDTAINVSLELIAVERHLQSIGQAYSDSAQQLFHEFCQRSGMTAAEEDERFKWCHEKNPSPSCGNDGIAACIRGWYWREVVKPDRSIRVKPKLICSNNKSSPNGKTHSKFEDKQGSDTGDTTGKSDGSKQVILNLSQTVTSVTALLEKGLVDYEERHYLDIIFGQSQVSRTAFWQLVSSLRCGFDEITGQDRQRLSNLIEGNHKTLNLAQLLPKPLADAMNHDGEILNIDPVTLLQYLLPALLSLVGKRINLDMGSHQIPAILWTCIVGESGTGKSRGEKVILDPLKKLQHAESKRFKEALAEYKELEKMCSKDEPSPPPPTPQRKYIFEVATIQAVMRRLSEQGLNGSLWARDEIAGLFKSLNQFKTSGGENEGLECLLKMWDGDGSFVDRVKADEDSYSMETTRLSIAGGIQPGAFRDAFKRPDDPQGLQARILYATPQVKPAKRIKGNLYLNDLLPAFYQWLDQLASGSVKLSSDADALYSQLVEYIGIEAEKSPNAAIRAWMRKLSPQLLRIALALHFIDCYWERDRNQKEIQIDTLERAWVACGYYRSCFEVVTEKANDSDDISSIFLKIYDFSLKHPEGLTPRAIYRKVKELERRAKELGRDVGAYTIEMLGQLVHLGQGVLEKKGRFYKFFAKVKTCMNSNFPGVVTEAIPELTQSPSVLEVSLQDSVSPVTVNIETVTRRMMGDSNPPSTQTTNLPQMINYQLTVETDLVGDSDLKENTLVTGEQSLVTGVDQSFCNDSPSVIAELEVIPPSSQVTHNEINSEFQRLLKILDELENQAVNQTEDEWMTLYEESQALVLSCPSLDEICPDYWTRFMATFNQCTEPASPPPPTLNELKALMLACETWTQLKHLQKEHGAKAKAAYKELTSEQQIKVDGITATAISHDVYKYVGPQEKLQGQILEPGALVYIDPTKSTKSRRWVSVWLLQGIELGWRCAIRVSRDCLQFVEKVVSDGLDAVEGHQGNLLDDLS
ncbi:DUF3987 domain-containing protein [Crocosphaera sp. XPORK-15E]|uniref:DUF3987 domain-containing protein n=1 Tax=Crocosphaera sp. XPORK-15E TaxID=3110247 RepID=UPI002B205022|nr:DUF3987 domain-containing protein [Crocosphaera sp. XPORK-15E]MEA5537351.1 DUF3987 domain-containing protein [Crocosphaera sp. XPORK-15E]